jgi:hypothetical protein
MSHLEQEMERAKNAYAAKMARLRRKAAAEQKRIDEMVIELLRENHAALYAELGSAARGALDTKPKRRTKRSESTPSEPDPMSAPAAESTPWVDRESLFPDQVDPREEW